MNIERFKKHNSMVLEDLLREKLGQPFEYEVEWGMPIVEVKVTLKDVGIYLFFIDLIEQRYVISIISKNPFMPVIVDSMLIDHVVDTVFEATNKKLTLENYLS